MKARSRARELLTERVAARRAAEKANEADLAELLQLIADATSNDETRDRSIASARASYDAEVVKVREAHELQASNIRKSQSICINRLRDRGEPAADIAALTGMTAIEVGRLSRNGADHASVDVIPIGVTPASFPAAPNKKIPGNDQDESAPHADKG